MKAEDRDIEYNIFGEMGEGDFDLYSDAQITDLLAAHFVDTAEDYAVVYLGEFA